MSQRIKIYVAEIGTDGFSYPEVFAVPFADSNGVEYAMDVCRAIVEKRGLRIFSFREVMVSDLSTTQQYAKMVSDVLPVI